MAKEKTHFVKQVVEYLYPAKNRVIAAVAFVRTFKQTLTGAGVVGGGGLITVTANDLALISWDIVIYTGIALVLTAFIAGATAFDDVSRNGLNSKYMDAAAVIAPPVVIDAGAVGTAVKGLTESRPFWMVPAPAKAPVIPTEPVTAAPADKLAARKASVKAKATAAANKVVENTMKADQAPAVEIAE
jgi:hypothetical protein